MVINGIDKIKDDGGDYLLLTDYYVEGIAVSGQYSSLGQALEALGDTNTGNPLCLVRLVRFDVAELPETV